MTTIITAFTSFGLAAVSIWFASERWIYAHHGGRKWLGDVLAEVRREFMQYTGIRFMSKYIGRTLKWARSRIKIARQGIRRVSTLTVVNGISLEGISDQGSSRDELPFSNTPEPTASPVWRHRRAGSDIGQSQSQQDLGSLRQGDSANLSPTAAAPAETPAETAASATKRRFTSAVRSVMSMQVATRVATNPFSMPDRKRTSSSVILGTSVPDQTRKSMLEPTVRTSRVATLVPQLRSLQMKHDWAAHQGLVRHLQFSPNGKFLATSRYESLLICTCQLPNFIHSWDRTAVIFGVGVGQTFGIFSTELKISRIHSTNTVFLRTLKHSDFWGRCHGVYESTLDL